jgi:hypothetical protein
LSGIDVLLSLVFSADKPAPELIGFLGGISPLQN